MANLNSFVTSEMKLRYLQRRIDEADTFEEKLKARDFDYFRNLGHQIKGNAVTFDFPMLTSLGVSLENFAVAKDVTQTERVAQDLKVAVHSLYEKSMDPIEKIKPEI